MAALGWGLAERQGGVGATRGAWSSGESCPGLASPGSPLGEPSRGLVQEERSCTGGTVGTKGLLISGFFFLFAYTG